MKYLSMLTIVDSDRNASSRPDHLRYVSELFRQGKVLAAGPHPDGLGGLVIYDCETDEEAQRLAAADPAVTSGARTFTLRAWETLDLPLHR